MRTTIPIAPIYARRCALNLTVAQVAAHVQVSPQTIRLYEQGHINPSPATFKRLARALKLTEAQLRQEGT